MRLCIFSKPSNQESSVDEPSIIRRSVLNHSQPLSNFFFFFSAVIGTGVVNGCVGPLWFEEQLGCRIPFFEVQEETPLKLSAGLFHQPAHKAKHGRECFLLTVRSSLLPGSRHRAHRLETGLNSCVRNLSPCTFFPLPLLSSFLNSQPSGPRC